MKLPEIELDDRRFQDLVSEARLRINRSCPEWTEHNVSDPGITLIELFAWMTEMTIYRLNRVPDKLHVTLLELLGIQLDGPSAAAADVRFRLVEPPTEPVTISGGETEVATPRTANEESIVFQVDDDFTIPPARPAAYVLQRGGQIKDVGVADGEARPQGADQMPFGNPPAVGDALYIGFDEPLARLLMQVDVDASPARGAGVNPEDPPLRWEVSQGDNAWEEAIVLEDLTGGFNYGAGAVELQLPDALGGPAAGRPPPALAALPHRRQDAPRQRRDHLHAGAGDLLDHRRADRRAAAGLARRARGQRDARRVRRHAGPDLPAPLQPGAEADDRRDARGPRPRVGRLGGVGAAPRLRRLDGVRPPLHAQPRRRRDRARPRDPRDRRRLDAVRRDPAQGRGAALHALPPRRRPRRATSPRARSTCCGRSLPGVDTVTNPVAASGGVDAEALEHARQRAAMEIRTRYRAVTAEDFEFLAGEASPRVARAVCVPPQTTGGPVQLHLVPQLFPADRQIAYDELVPNESLMQEVSEYLDERRLIGTTVQLLPCAYRGLSVVVNLQASPLADTARVEEDVAHALYTYLNPLVGGNPTGPGQGWAFGRALNQGELYGVVHAVDGVEFVKILRIYETNLQTGEQNSKPAGSHIVLEPDELIASASHIVKATHRET